MKVVVIRTELYISSGEQLREVFGHIAAIRKALCFVAPEGSPVDKFGGCRELCRCGGINHADYRLLERTDGSGYVVTNFKFCQLGVADTIDKAWGLFCFVAEHGVEITFSRHGGGGAASL